MAKGFLGAAVQSPQLTSGQFESRLYYHFRTVTDLGRNNLKDSETRTYSCSIMMLDDQQMLAREARRSVGVWALLVLSA